MPLHPPRTLEPYKKKETLAKREQQLRHALTTGAATERLHRAAQNVRLAQLAVLKAEQELIRYDSESQERGRHLESIAKKRDAWRDMSTETIIQQYSASPK